MTSQTLMAGLRRHKRQCHIPKERFGEVAVDVGIDRDILEAWSLKGVLRQGHFADVVKDYFSRKKYDANRINNRCRANTVHGAK